MLLIFNDIEAKFNGNSMRGLPIQPLLKLFSISNDNTIFQYIYAGNYIYKNLPRFFLDNLYSICFNRLMHLIMQIDFNLVLKYCKSSMPPQYLLTQ